MSIPGSLKQIQAIRADLDNLRHFVTGLENSLAEQARHANRPPEKDGGIWHIDEILPWLYRSSALLTVLGFLEHNLNSVCDSLMKERRCDTRITDLPGKGLRRSKLYIQRYPGLDFPAGSESWNFLLKYSDIRNLIAHRDSMIKDDDPELIRFIESDPNLSIDESGRVRLHERALFELIDHLDIFFEELSERIRPATS